MHPSEHTDVDGVPIAFLKQEGSSPGVVWLGGYRSDMRGTKAEALAQWAEQEKHAFLRLDYSGHGESGGDFANGTISLWLSQALAVFRAETAGPQIVVGSSMGAWIALRLVQALSGPDTAGRIAGLVLIAPAPDFTSDLVEPKLSDDQKRSLAEQGSFEVPSDYGGASLYTAKLIEDGRTNRVLTAPIDTHCPVHVLQGMRDPDVPYAHALKLVGLLPADDVTLSLIPDGDHRLSRPQDIAMMLESVSQMIAHDGA